MHVVHPSPLSRWGREIGVSRIENEGDADLTGMIARGLDASPALAVVPAAQQRMRVVGRLEQSVIEPERLSSRPTTCTRMVPTQQTVPVPVYVGNPPRLTTQMQTQTIMVAHPYPCTELIRTVGAHVRLRITINALTRPIREVFARVFNAQDSQSTTGLQGSDSDDHPPPPIDGLAVLHAVQEQAVTAFLDAVLPRDEAVDVEFANCQDNRCDAGLTMVRAGNLEGAFAQFSQVVEAAGSRVPSDPRARERLAAALFDRGIVRGYSGEVDQGIADLQRAISLNPSAPTWNEHLQRLRALQREHQRTRFRGETHRLGEGH